MPYLGILGVELKKNCCHIWSQHIQICLIAKFCEETKMPKFGTKNALFGYFWAGIWKHYCHILNQQSRICLTETFHEIIKMRKFVTKNALLVYFWARFYKFVVIFEVNTLTIRSTFAKDLRSSFPKGPGSGPGSGPLYKLCRVSLKMYLFEIGTFYFAL